MHRYSLFVIRLCTYHNIFIYFPTVGKCSRPVAPVWKFQKRDAVNVHRLMPFLNTVPSRGCMSGQGSAFHGFCIFLTAPFCTKYRCGQTVWASQPALHDYAKSEFLSAAVNPYCVKRRCLGIIESRDSASLPWHTFPLLARMTKRHRPLLQQSRSEISAHSGQDGLLHLPNSRKAICYIWFYMQSRIT